MNKISNEGIYSNESLFTRSCSVLMELMQIYSMVDGWLNQIVRSDYVAKLLSPASPNPGIIKLWHKTTEEVIHHQKHGPLCINNEHRFIIHEFRN